MIITCLLPSFLLLPLIAASLSSDDDISFEVIDPSSDQKIAPNAILTFNGLGCVLKEDYMVEAKHKVAPSDSVAKGALESIDANAGSYQTEDIPDATHSANSGTAAESLSGSSRLPSLKVKSHVIDVAKVGKDALEGNHFPASANLHVHGVSQLGAQDEQELQNSWQSLANNPESKLSEPEDQLPNETVQSAISGSRLSMLTEPEVQIEGAKDGDILSFNHGNGSQSPRYEDYLDSSDGARRFFSELELIILDRPEEYQDVSLDESDGFFRNDAIGHNSFAEEQNFMEEFSLFKIFFPDYPGTL